MEKTEARISAANIGPAPEATKGVSHVPYNEFERRRNAFLKFPQFLYKDSEYDGLTNTEKLAYSILADRFCLSENNEESFTDRNGDIYFFMSREELGFYLDASKDTVTKIFYALKKHNLLREVRLGQGKNNRLYLLRPQAPKFDKVYKKKPPTCKGWRENEPDSGNASVSAHSNRILNSRSQDRILNFRIEESNNSEVKTSDISNAELQENSIPSYIIKTYDNHTELSQSVSQSEPEKKTDRPTDRHSSASEKIIFMQLEGPSVRKEPQPETPESSLAQKIDATRLYIQDNIGYEGFVSFRGDELPFVDELVQIMLDVHFTDTDYIKIKGEMKPREIVKSVFMKLKNEHINYVINRFFKYEESITNKRGFLETMLYNSYSEANAAIENTISADGLRDAGKKRLY